MLNAYEKSLKNTTSNIIYENIIQEAIPKKPTAANILII